MASAGDVQEITVLKSQPDSDKALELLRKIASVSSHCSLSDLRANVIGGPRANGNLRSSLAHSTFRSFPLPQIAKSLSVITID